MTEKEVLYSFNLYKKGLSASEICKIVGYTPHTILNGIRKIDPSIIRSKAGYKESWNEHYFEFIDTETKAYLLGFIMADGNINERYNSQPAIRLEVHSKDVSVLELMKKEFNSVNKITLNKKRNHVRFSVHSSIMANDLAKYGVVPRKTGIERFPLELLDDTMRQHFLRGFFDGDGWFSIVHRRNRKKHTFSLGFAKNIHMLMDIRNFLSSVIEDLSLVKIVHVKGYPEYGMLLFNKKKNVLDIANFLYKDATVYLKRKFETYQKILKISRGQEFLILSL